MEISEKGEWNNISITSLCLLTVHVNCFYCRVSKIRGIGDRTAEEGKYAGWRKEGVADFIYFLNISEIPTSIEIIDVSEYRPLKIPSPQWRECIKKVWEVDPLSCPKCGCEMKIISFINEVDVIHKILEHLGLWEDKTPLERAPPVSIPEKNY